MNYYIDTEFHEGFHKPLFGKKRHFIDFISIGIVSEDNREYYAISKEFDVKAAWNRLQITTGSNEAPNYWIRDNVLLPIYKNAISGDGRNIHEFSLSTMEWIIKRIGKTNEQIAEEIKEFVYNPYSINVLGENKPYLEFYGYYADYDWVLLCSLYGRMTDLPKFFPFYCRDLKQMYDDKNDWTAKVQLRHLDSYPKKTNAHNALADAKWNKELHEFLLKLKA